MTVLFTLPTAFLGLETCDVPWLAIPSSGKTQINQIFLLRLYFPGSYSLSFLCTFSKQLCPSSCARPPARHSFSCGCAVEQCLGFSIHMSYWPPSMEPSLCFSCSSTILLAHVQLVGPFLLVCCLVSTQCLHTPHLSLLKIFVSFCFHDVFPIWQDFFEV